MRSLPLVCLQRSDLPAEEKLLRPIAAAQLDRPDRVCHADMQFLATTKVRTPWACMGYGTTTGCLHRMHLIRLYSYTRPCSGGEEVYYLKIAPDKPSPIPRRFIERLNIEVFDPKDLDSNILLTGSLALCFTLCSKLKHSPCENLIRWLNHIMQCTYGLMIPTALQSPLY